MNVACTACPAKYAVPDERVRGKRVRITCKHCGTFIVVDGTGLGAGSGSHVGPPPGANNNVRERRQTMLGIGSPNANAAASLGVPVGGASSHHAWLVALSDGRREPASLARIVDLFASGAIGAQTYIWREGMSDWKKPFEISEIAAALRARGIGPGGVTKGLSLPPPDQDEATRVSFAPNEEQLQGKASSSPPPQAQRPSTAPAATTKFDDESVTVARSGPPSNPIALSKPLNSPSGTPGRNRPTLPPLQPAAGRPPLPPPSEAVARPRPNTIPPIGLGAARPARSLTPSSSPFAVAAAAAAGVPVTASPSAPPPPPPPPPPVVAPSSPPPAPSFPDASAFVAKAAPAVSAPYVAPAQFPAPRAEFEVAPRSGPPVALQLDDDPFRRRRSKAPLVVLSLLVVAGAGAAGFMFLGQRPAAPPAPSSVAVQPPPTPAPPPPTAPAPVASESAAPAASASAAEAPSAAPEKTASKATAPRAKRDEAAPARASARRPANADSTSSDSSGSDTGSTPESSTPESSVAERLARGSAASDDPPPAPKGNANDPEFNREAAAQGLGDAASRADSCRALGGPSGTGQATVTFSPNGRVSAASVGGEFAGTTVGACITRLFRGVTVPAFSGDAVTVSKRFTIE